MGKIIQEKFPNLDDEDREAVRQHAIAALNFDSSAKSVGEFRLWKFSKCMK